MIFECSSFCVADSYDIDPLAKTLRERGLDPRFYDNVIYVNILTEEANQHIFFFPYGCVVCWGMSYEETQYYIKLASEHAGKPLTKLMIDECRYRFGEETIIVEEEDEIILESTDPLIFLSLSYALSQSVKLTSFEDSIDQTIQKTQHLPEEMATKGSTSLSRKQLSKYIGALFAKRHSINLHNDLLDTPEFFWRRPAYESYYQMGIIYLDIATRTNILHQRLSAVHELYQILSDKLKHLHSSRLELTIIYLIVIEVLVAILKDILKWI